MKFDVTVLSAGKVVVELENVGFLAAIALLVGFPRKKYEAISMIISTHVNDED